MTEFVIVLRSCKSNIRLSPRVRVCVSGVGVGEDVERNHLYGEFEKQI